MNTKNIMVGVLAVVVAGGVFLPKVFAETTTPQNPMASLVQKIADKFKLNKSDVQAVFDQDRSDREAERTAKNEERLSELVKDGKITEAQKQLILAKQKELQTARQSQMQDMQGKSEEERKALMEKEKTQREGEKTALDAWAKQNGIDVQYLMGFGGHGHGFGSNESKP